MKENQWLTSEEKVFIDKVRKEASHFELWNFKGLNIGWTNALRFIKENCSFCD